MVLPSTTTLLALALSLSPLVSAVCTKQTPPEGTICGTKSYAFSSQNFLKGTSYGPAVESVEACAAFTKDISGEGFFFAPLGTRVSICQPFSGAVVSIMNVNSDSSFAVYDASCFKCDPPAAVHTPISPGSGFFPLGNSSSPFGTGTAAGTGFAASTGFPVATGSPPPPPGSPAPIGTTPGGSTPGGPVGGGSSSSSPAPAPAPVGGSGGSQASTTAGPGAIQTITGVTTSTVYATQTRTITSCASTVTACPYGSVVTETIALYTTICPYTSTYTSIPTQGAGSSAGNTAPVVPAGYTVSTVYATNVYTVTACPQTVTACPYGSVTTETRSLYTTICPISNAVPTSAVKPTSVVSPLVQSATSAWIAKPSVKSNGTETGVLISTYAAQPTGPAKPSFTGAATNVKVGVVGVGIMAGLAALLSL